MNTTLDARDLSLDDRDFAFIVNLVKEKTGIVLTDQKRHMVYARLAKRLRLLNLTDFKDYCAYIESADGALELTEALNAITTNLTRFFREKHHFDHMAGEVLSDAIWNGGIKGQKRLRIWSAACSTGEEPWSIAMVLKDALHDIDQWDVRVLATDINTQVVQQAKDGIYTEQDAANIPEAMRRKYLQPIGDGKLRVVDSLRNLVVFKPLNLLTKWPMKGPFDIIFCRNVVIYFDKETQVRLAERFADIMEPGGWLYIGHSETLINVNQKFSPKGRSIYRRRNEQH